MKIFEKMKPKGSDSAGMYLLKLGMILVLFYAAIAVFSIGSVEVLQRFGVIPPDRTSYYDIDDPMCHSREGGLIVWIDVDNWIEVQGSDQEKLAKRVADGFIRRKKP